jgi:hypothetical protein
VPKARNPLREFLKQEREARISLDGYHVTQAAIPGAGTYTVATLKNLPEKTRRNDWQRRVSPRTGSGQPSAARRGRPRIEADYDMRTFTPLVVFL